MTGIHYELIDGGKRGRLLSPLEFETPIVGREVEIPELFIRIGVGGYLQLGADFEWDFGSYALDTPAMVLASAAHDAFCVMTDKGLLPWFVRAQSDKYFRDLLKENGVGFIRR